MGARVLLIIAIGYTALITTLSLVQLGTISVGNFHPTDKVMHVTAYFGLTFLWLFFYLFKKANDCKLRSGYLKISLLIIVFGMLIEVLQGILTSYREADLADIVANTIGVAIAFGFFVGFPNFLKNVKRHISSFL